ncbi:MAG: NAD(P)-dependent alcohol dehydrogenase [Polyangiales bacterium]
MKAYELHEKEGLEGLTLVDRPSPRVGPGDVRVRVRAVSLNFRDLGIARLRRKPGGPARVPTSDGAGEVVEVGADVRDVKVGDRVAASFFPTWHDGPLSASHHANALGGSIDGMLADEVVLPEASWVRLPEHLSFEEGATLPCAGVTAFHALFESASLRPGETVLLQGTGGVSIFALQLAKAAGARAIITSSSAEKRARATKLGADHTLDYKANPKWGDAANAWTEGRGVDVVVEVGGPGTFDQSVNALRYQGTMSILGVLTGTRGEVNTYGVFHKALRVHGVYVGSVAMFEGLNRVLTAHKIHPVIDRVFGFDEARAAYEYLASAQHFGKIVVRVGS